MGNKKSPFAHVITLSALAGTNTLKHDEVGSGRRYCYQHIAVINETNPYTRLRVMVRTGGLDSLLAEEKQPEADTLYWSNDPHYLIENDQLVAELTGCTASDALKLYVRGWFVEEGEGG